MKNSLLVIAGMPKCGTTALAKYLTDNGYASLLVPGVKEPYLFAEQNYYPPDSIRCLSLQRGERRWVLDASAGYATNTTALDRLRLFDPSVIVCVRNQFERSYSSYKMHKLLCSASEAKLAEINLRYRFSNTDHVDMGPLIEAITLLHFPSAAQEVVAGYLKLEAERLVNSTFIERLKYELSFLSSHRTFPFRSILSESFYTYPTKLLVNRFNGDVTFCSVSKISTDAATRTRFLATVLGSLDVTAPPLSAAFSLADLRLNEEAPDFQSSSYDFIRDTFRFDLQTFRTVLEKNKIDQTFLDFDDLERFLL